MKIRKGDNVKVIQGRDRGKQGKVIQIMPKYNKAVVDGINVASKNVRAKTQNEKGQVVKYNAPIDISNLMLIDPKNNKPTRVGYQVVNKKKERISRKSKQIIS
jgi:large subunit ribosomal protein L24